MGFVFCLPVDDVLSTSSLRSGIRALQGLPEKYTGLDDVAKPIYPNVYIFPFLPHVAFARNFMVNVRCTTLKATGLLSCL